MDSEAFFKWISNWKPLYEKFNLVRGDLECGYYEEKIE